MSNYVWYEEVVYLLKWRHEVNIRWCGLSIVQKLRLFIERRTKVFPFLQMLHISLNGEQDYERTKCFQPFLHQPLQGFRFQTGTLKAGLLSEKHLLGIFFLFLR